MYRRSDVRHACFRAKKNVASEKHQKILSEVEKLLAPGQNWTNFSTVWDVLIDRAGKLLIVKPETDYEFIHTTCLEASLCFKNNISFDNFNHRQQNVVAMVEALMLDNVTSWANYNVAWGVELEGELKTLRTKLYNVSSTQIEVTEDMIKSSMKDADGSAFQARDNATEFEMKPMTEEQRKAFEEFLSKKQSKGDKE